MMALVGCGERKRWVVASANTKVGDMLKSTRDESVEDRECHLNIHHDPFHAALVQTCVCVATC